MPAYDRTALSVGVAPNGQRPIRAPTQSSDGRSCPNAGRRLRRRHGTARDLFTVWFGSNFMLLTIVTGGLAVTVFSLPTRREARLQRDDQVHV
jgi:hypothetical protein